MPDPMSEQQVEERVRELTEALRELGMEMEDQLDAINEARRGLEAAYDRYGGLMSSWADNADALLRASLPEGHPFTKPLELDVPSEELRD